MNSIHLIGAEDVSRAGSTMSAAARDMQSAASSIQYAFESHQRFLDDWLQRLEIIMKPEAGEPT